MACCCSIPKSPEKDKSDKIDEFIMKDGKKFLSAIRILLLGTGESGKSTILKQMKLIHTDEGFSAEERLERVSDIRSNVHVSIRKIVKYMQLLEIEFENAANKHNANYIIDLGKKLPAEYDRAKYVERVTALWKDRGVKACFYRSNEYQIIDSAKYFLEKVATIMAENYMPTTEDLLKSRIKTTGIKEMRFSVKISRQKQQEFIMIDVGGQRSYRQKWIQVFVDINTILFLISSAEFDLTLREDHTVNRMSESIKVFQDVWRNRFLRHSGIIVFLNKQDILEEKIKRGVKMQDYFPEFLTFNPDKKDIEPKLPKEYQRVRLFVRHKMLKITAVQVLYGTQGRNSKGRDPNCYFHFTIATDVNNIRKVFMACQRIILSSNIANHTAF